MPFLYVSTQEFLQTDFPTKTGRRESAAHNHKLKTRSQLGTQAAIGFEFTVLS